MRARSLSTEAAIVGGAAAVVAIGMFAATASSSRLPLVVLAVFVLGIYATANARHLRRALLAVILLDLVLQWDVNLGYRSSAAEIGAEGGLNVSLTSFALAGLYALWAVERSRPRSGAPPLLLKAALPLVTYVAISAVSIAAARDPVLGGYQLALLLQTLLLFVYLASTVRDSAELLFVITILMVALVLEGTIMLALEATGAGFNVAGLDAYARAPAPALDGSLANRAAGTLGSPNTAGSVLSPLLALALGLLVAPVNRRLRALAMVGIVVGLPALVLTGSRGGWISFLVAFAIVGVVATRRGLVPLRTVAGAALVIAVVVLPVGGIVAARISDEDGGAAGSRIPLARLAVDMIEDHPLLGVGLNNAGVSIPFYAGSDFTREWLYTVHNKYLLVASESGLLALAAFLWFLVGILAAATRCLRSTEPLLAALGIGMLGALVGYTVNMSVDIFSNRAQVQMLCVLGAIVAAMAGLPQRRTGADIVRSTDGRRLAVTAYERLAS